MANHPRYWRNENADDDPCGTHAQEWGRFVDGGCPRFLVRRGGFRYFGVAFAMNEGFEDFRKLYPRNGDEAELMWRLWVPLLRNFTSEQILEGTKRWVTYWQQELTPTQFIPKPVSFLRSHQFLDIPTQSRGKAWLGSPEPSPLRWSANWPKEAPISGPITIAPPEPLEPIRPTFRTAKEILAARGRS